MIVLPGIDAFDLVGPTIQAGFPIVGFADIALIAVGIGAFPPVFRQISNHVAHDASASSRLPLLSEGESHFAVAGFLGLCHVMIVLVVERALLFQDIERPNDIISRDRLAIMPFRCLDLAEIWSTKNHPDKHTASAIRP